MVRSELAGKLTTLNDFEYFSESTLLNLSKLGVSQIRWHYAQINFTEGKVGQGVLREDPIVWIDGARSPQISLITSLTNSKFDKLRQKKVSGNSSKRQLIETATHRSGNSPNAL
jgi:hypothetical protein